MNKELLLITTNDFQKILPSLLNQDNLIPLQEWETFAGSLGEHKSGFIGFWSDETDVLKSQAGCAVRQEAVQYIILTINPDNTWKMTFSGIPGFFSGYVHSLNGNIFKPLECDLQIEENNLNFSINLLILHDFLVAHQWIQGLTSEEMTSDIAERIRQGETVDFNYF